MIKIRNMTAADLRWALDLTDAEGWNPGLHDAACFFEEDPEGFFIAEADGVPVGCVSCVFYDDSFGFAGLFVVRPEWRNRGVGSLLARAAMLRAGERNIGQDAVVEMRQRYEQMGFEVAFSSSRFAGIAASGAGARPSEVDVVGLEGIGFTALADYDASCFPVRRDRFLARWVRMPESSYRVAVGDGQIAGYGVIRACRRGYKIGPLFADDPMIAEALLDSLAAGVKGDPIYLDVPSPNGAGRELALSRGMKAVFETNRMYNRGEPPLPLEKVFGITSFEFG